MKVRMIKVVSAGMPGEWEPTFRIQFKKQWFKPWQTIRVFRGNKERGEAHDYYDKFKRSGVLEQEIILRPRLGEK